MTLRPDTIRPPAHIREQREGRTLTYKHNRSRRIYRVRDYDSQRNLYGIVTQTGRRARVIPGVRLDEDFTRVARCACGHHHDVRRPRHT